MRQHDFDRRRADMVDQQLAARGVDDQRVLAAMGQVPREEFVPRSAVGKAYSDRALPIGRGQTISQPYVVARIMQSLALRGTERVLEVGTGSGYSAAVCARLAAEVITVERDAELAAGALQTLGRLGVSNVDVIVADGSAGLPEQAPYDAIAVHALASEDPQPFLEQLVAGGRLVIPLPGQVSDRLTLFTERDGRFHREVVDLVRFVPLVPDRS